MKSALLTFVCLMATVSAFQPMMMATRVVSKAKSKVKQDIKTVKKEATKVQAKVQKEIKKNLPTQIKRTIPLFPELSAPSGDAAYPSWQASASKIKFKISGGGNKAPPKPFSPPDFSNPKWQIDRDPAFYAEAAKKRLKKSIENFAFDDGLTELERSQRKSLPDYLTGSAKSQIDKSAIRADLQGSDFFFGLDSDRFQLLFISIFGLLTLVGCLSGNIKL